MDHLIINKTLNVLVFYISHEQEEKTKAYLASALILLFITFNRFLFPTSSFLSIFRYPRSETFPTSAWSPCTSYLCSFSHRQIPLWYGLLTMFHSSLSHPRCSFLVSLWTSVFICLPVPRISEAGTQGDGVITLGATASIMPLEQQRIYPMSFHYITLFSVTSAPLYLITSLLASPSAVSYFTPQSPSSLHCRSKHYLLPLRTLLVF